MLRAEGLGTELRETLAEVKLEAHVLLNHDMANADVRTGCG
jgi:hypothetical protein